MARIDRAVGFLFSSMLSSSDNPSMNSHFKLGRAPASLILFGVTAFIAGCSGRPSLLPNSDPALQKTSTAFAVDSAKRFPYKADAPQGGDAIGRAQVGYMVKRVEIVNNSADVWNNVEVWLNQKYVVFVPVMKPHDLKRLPFLMFFDDQGNAFPKENSSANDSLVKKIEILMDGKMYNVPIQPVDY
jgi:hypothetical protein